MSYDISSSSNKFFKTLQALTTGAGLKKQSLALVSGEKITQERVTLLSTKNTTESFWIFPQSPDTRSSIKWITLTPALFDQLDICGTKKPLLVTPQPSVAKYQPEAPLAGVELICALGDPNNLGALLRSALAFEVERVVLLQESCHPFHPKVTKSASGSNWQLPLFKGPSIKELPPLQQLYALDARGQSLLDSPLKLPLRLLLGEEGQGIPETLSPQTISLPTNPRLESLNATVAASLALHELYKLRDS